MSSSSAKQSTWQAVMSDLTQQLEQFQLRPAQETMANAVQQALQCGEDLLCEAPTGTGKTYAYLVPLLASGHKAIVSTASKTLQDQLFHRDLPKIKPVLANGIRFALLKGRANYLCAYRLDNALQHGDLIDKQQLRQLQLVHEFASTTTTGDIAECSSLAEDASIWPYVTSTVENCLGQECPKIGQCHALKARKKALEADIVVVNHHLLFADHVLKDDGFGELLPKVDTVIFDEAHQLPEIALKFFSQSFTSRKLVQLAEESLLELSKEASDMAELSDELNKLIAAAQYFRKAHPTADSRGAWSALLSHQPFQQALTTLQQTLAAVVEQLAVAAPRAKSLAHCHQRAEELYNDMQIMTDSEQQQDHVHWYELFTRSLVVHVTPLSIAAQFQQYLQQPNNWIFTSATLTTQQHFAYFRNSLGIEASTAELALDSPFDFYQQGLLYVPRSLPNPNSANYVNACVQAALPVIKAAKGRTFFLFTSHKALRQAAEQLALLVDYPLLIQGEASRFELLQQFQTVDNAILLGTASFWEGIDIKGQALSCVIIDRLPFVSPADPVNQARIAAYRARGEDPFAVYQLPRAVIMLKQGAGRLIRDKHDKGVLMVCDHRLVSKHYGRDFLQSLPAFKRTRSLTTVENFFSALEEPVE